MGLFHDRSRSARSESDSADSTPRPAPGAVMADAPGNRALPGMRAGQVVAVAILGLSFLLADLPPLHHSDVWGHLKVGEWILEHGRLPSREPLCAFSDQDADYV